jgi:hypothetical protein
MEIIEVNLRSCLFLSFVLVLASCAGGNDIAASRFGPPFTLDYGTRDAPSEKKIYVSFRNTMNFPICLGAENWPNNGILLNDGKTVSVVVAGKTKFLKLEQDYCPRCSIRVAPQSESVAYFKYESFDLPETMTRIDKALSFTLLGYQCR